MTNLTIDFSSVIDLTDEQFFQLCQKNLDLRFERNAKGDLIIMSPTGGKTSNINAGLNPQLWNWIGKIFDLSGGLKLLITDN